MSTPVRVVTDSTAYLSAEECAELGVIVVPVQVIIDGRNYREGIDITTADVAQALRQGSSVSTSRPAPADFAAAYDRAAGEGAAAIVSAHISQELSGTYQTGVMMAKDAPVPTTVVDSRNLSMGLGYAVAAGARAAKAGGDAEAVAETIRAQSSTSRLFFYVDTLEYLKKGGRVSRASAAFGTALRVKPLLHLWDGRVELMEKVRTASRALDRLAELAITAIDEISNDGHHAQLAIQHIDAAERADGLHAQISSRVANPGALDIRVLEVGAVVGAHVGPGMVSVVISPLHTD